MNALFCTTKDWKNPRCGGYLSEVKDCGRKLFCTRKPRQKWLDLLAVCVCLHDVHTVPQTRLSRPSQEDGAFQTSTVSLSHYQKPVSELGKEASVLHSFLRASVSLAGWCKWSLI